MLHTADWVQLERRHFYRKKTLYSSLAWQSELNFEDCYVSSCTFGGPVAVWQKSVQSPSKQIILIYSCSGIRISSIVWSSGQFLTCGWSENEELVCIQNDGTVHVYNLYGEKIRSFGLGKDAKDSKIIEARIYRSPAGTGVVVLTTLYRFYAMTNIEVGTLKRLPDVPGLTSLPSCWSAFANDDSQKTVVFVANNKDIFLLNPSETATFQKYPEINDFGKIIQVAFSRMGESVAMATENGTLWIGSSDLKDKYCEIALKDSAVRQIVWCGITAVVCSLEDSVTLVSTEGNLITYYYSSLTYLVQELDCVRVFTDDVHDLIQKVPKVTLDIFRIGSIEPGSMLLEAAKEYQKKSYKCEEYIRLTRNQLAKAVQQCTEAAGHEFDPKLQKSLLKAAQIGKGFIEGHDPEKFVLMARTLRVLNAVRNEQIGIPITIDQVNYSSIAVLLERLVSRRQFQLALEAAKFMELSKTDVISQILTHWVCYKMKEVGQDPEVVAREIAEKVRDLQGISPGDIAAKAMLLNKKEVHAKVSSMQVYAKLLEYESNSRKQVRLLLKMDQESERSTLKIDKTALSRALESGDGDLIVEVLLYLKAKMNKGEFQMFVRQHPVALATYVNILREKVPASLRDIYEQEDDYLQESFYFLEEAFFQTEVNFHRCFASV
ncbi:hypothetical protein QYM36_003806 [Artemia franciscana]|uniref:Vacuolar protein sorting-associated protein 16 homolog n=1 Tax=Artemia franciscana TaxID=6661 RepID=A0AA88I856_ARTSF|nr:hypothetical protein QYM36_003806 [Artemia franciscana]